MLAALVIASAAQAADKLVLQLHGPAQFQFAGYYAALWQGYYRDAGIDVEIKPGAAPGQAAIDPVREVAEGRAQFGTDTAELVVRAAQGLPLLVLAPIFQRSGAGVYYRSEESFPSPAALAKARVGRLPASDILDIELATALRAEGVDLDSLKPVPLEPGQTVAALAQRSVDVAPGSAWDAPWLAHEKGFAVKSFDPADYRVEFYGDTLFTLKRFAAAEPAILRGFREASLKGWEYALRNPDEMGARLMAELPRPAGVADVGGFTRYQAQVAGVLARFPTVALGHSNPERWRRMQASMLGVGALLGTADPGDFVYDPDAELRSRTDRRDLTIIGATLLVALVVTAWLWRRQRRSARAAASSGAAADAAPAAASPPQPATAAETPSAAKPATEPAPAAPTPAAPTPAATKPEAGPADLNAVLTRLDRAMRHLAPRRAGFRTSLLPELWRCHAEPETVRRLMLDLVAAAAADLKGADLRGKGELVVGTRNFSFDAAAVADTPGARPGEFARVTVRDNGPGLSDEALDRVLDPAGTVRPAVPAAAQVLRALGGFVRVESAEGIGTAVHLYFPRAPSSSESAKPAQAAE